MTCAPASGCMSRDSAGSLPASAAEPGRDAGATSARNRIVVAEDLMRSHPTRRARSSRLAGLAGNVLHHQLQRARALVLVHVEAVDREDRSRERLGVVEA